MLGHQSTKGAGGIPALRPSWRRRGDMLMKRPTSPGAMVLLSLSRTCVGVMSNNSARRQDSELAGAVAVGRELNGVFREMLLEGVAGGELGARRIRGEPDRENARSRTGQRSPPTRTARCLGLETSCLNAQVGCEFLWRGSESTESSSESRRGVGS